MKLKNINTSLLVLSGLLILSFAFFVVAQENNFNTKSIFLDSDQDGLADSEEKTYGTDPKNPDTDGDGYKDGTEVSAGYDPLRPAPGDKLINNERDKQNTSEVKGVEDFSSKENLTQILAQKISAIADEQNTEGQTMSTDEVQEIISSSIPEPSIEEELPEISEKDIKIKKQNYGKIDEKEEEKKKKEDFIEYLSAVMYIFASNSPEPLTSTTDLNNIITQITDQISSALISRKPEDLDGLEKSGKKIAEQIREVEVPEELVETHIKSLKYIEYMKNIKGLIKINPDDPVSGLINYSKIQVFVENLLGFYEDIQKNMNKYNIEYSEIEKKIERFGIKLPNDIDDSTIEESSENE